MFSKLRPQLMYTDISPDVVEHDDDVDADEWNYNGRHVYRGVYDPRYFAEKLHVYWLYDTTLKRIGLAEHEEDQPEKYEALWFMENEYATLFQNSEWKSREMTIWKLLGEYAYIDCLDSDIYEKCLQSNVLLINPTTILKKNHYYDCRNCGKSFEPKCQNAIKKFDLTDFTIFYIDNNFIIYDPPTDFTLENLHRLQTMQEQELDAS